ncbi:MAG: UDPglucose 6-dehydrogenase, partial [Psychromonas sp.]
VKSGKKAGYDFEIINSVLEVNEKQKTAIVSKVVDHFGGVKGKKFALWGLAFKPDTDDIREASALYIIEKLVAMGAEIVAYDPEAMPNVKAHFGNKIGYANNQYDALHDADALLIATEWGTFKNPDFDKLKSLLKTPTIFDGRNLYTLEQMKTLGFYYNSIGRQTVIPF